MILSRTKLASVFFLPVYLASWNAEACYLEKAVYRLKQSPKQASLYFEKAAEPNIFGDLTVVVRSENTGRSYPLSFFVSNGYGAASLSTPDRPGTANKKEFVSYSNVGTLVFFFDESLNVVYASMANDKAPPYLFLPELGPSLYYGGDATIPDREVLPSEMWVLSECR